MLNTIINMEWITAIGTGAFAVSGYLLGVKKQLDLLGIVILALLTSIGGGVIRDVMLARVPLVFYQHSAVTIVVATLVVSWMAGLHKRTSITFDRLFIVADSLGLVAFSLAGAQFGLAFGLSAFRVILLGFVTAVGGGIVRDVLVNEVPFILHKDFYGTVAILVAGILVVLHKIDAVNVVTLQLLLAFGLALRLFAHWRELVLPRIINEVPEAKGNGMQ